MKKNINPSKVIYCLLVAIFMMTMQSCMETPGIQQETEIAKTDRDEMHGIIKKMIQAMKTENVDYLYNMFSDSAKKIATKEVIKNALRAINIEKGQELMNVEGEFIVTNNFTSKIDSVISRGYNYEYVYHFRPANAKTYIYLCSVNTTDGIRKLISCVFTKTHGEWKILTMNFGLFSYNKLQAPDYYGIANEKYDANDFICAALNVEMCRALIDPASGAFVYPQEMEIQCKKIITEAAQRYTLPMKINSIATKPSIIDVAMQTHCMKIYPTVRYYSNIDIHDSMAIVKENNELHDMIRKIFPHINEMGDSIMYIAGNENSETSRSSHQMMLMKWNSKVDTAQLNKLL